MTHMRSSSPDADTRSTPRRSTSWTGWLVFAACIMLLNGVLLMIQGLMALVNEDYFHVTASGLPLSVNYTVCSRAASAFCPETWLLVPSASCSPGSTPW
jgi:hypothetical protein